MASAVGVLGEIADAVPDVQQKKMNRMGTTWDNTRNILLHMGQIKYSRKLQACCESAGGLCVSEITSQWTEIEALATLPCQMAS